MANQIRFNIGFNVDRTGLNELQNALAQIQINASKATGTSQMERDLRKAGQAANQLGDILNQSWNSKLGQLDLSKVNKGIKQTFGSVKDLKTAMERGGASGTAAYNQIASAILNTNLQLKQSNKLLDSMATSMANTVKWGITSAIFNNITGSIQKAYGYTKKLDTSLNDIRIVTEKSAESMEKFAVKANGAAKELGASTLDYTQASLIYYQQGLSDEEVAARAETTLKAANVTGQSGEAVSEQLTAVWNGYKVSAQEAELYVDKLAAVAATTASDLEELSTGMSKVASAANAMGVDVDQLNAQLATIVSVTRQAPESVGTALKTIYARMSDLQLGGEDEDGLNLGRVSGTMEKMGISILDETGNLRDMGQVIEEVAKKWDGWTEAQKTAMAQVMAGKRQYNNLVALFENWDMYTDALETSANAAGTLQKQQDIYMESTEAHLKTLKAESERTYKILFNQDTINGFADALTGTLSIFNNFIEGIGGGGKAILYFGSLVANVFNQQIAKAIQGQIRNFEAYRNNLAGQSLKNQFINTFTGEAFAPSEEEITRSAQLRHASRGEKVSTAAVAEEAKIAREILKVEKALSAEQHAQLIEIQQKIGLNAQEIEDIQSYKKVFKDILNDENASFEIAQINLERIGNNLNEQRASLREINDLYSTRFDSNFVSTPENDAADRIQLEQQIVNLQNSSLTTEQQREQLSQLTRNNANELVLSEENIRTILSIQNQQISEQNRNYNLLNTAVDNMSLDEQGRTQELREQNEELARQVAQETHLAQRQINIGKTIKYATAATSALTAVVGGFSTFADESASKISKINAACSAVSGAVMGIGAAFGPVGMIIGGVVSAAITGFSAIYTAQQKNLEKAIEENKKQWEELRSDIEKSSSDIDNLKSLTTEFERLSLGVSRYGENISLTADEYKKYQDIVEQIVGISPDVVKGYTDEGKAIVDNNNLIQSSIDLLKEQQKEQKKLLLTDSNMEDTYAGAEQDYANAEIEVEEAKTEVRDILSEANDQYGTKLRTLSSFNFNIEELSEKYLPTQELKDQFKKDSEKINKLMTNEYGEIDISIMTKNREKIEAAIKNLQETYKIEDSDLWQNTEWEGTTDSFFNAFDDKITNADSGFDASLKKVDIATKELEQKKKALNDKVLTYLEVYDEGYTGASTEQQLATQRFVNAFETTDFSEETFDQFTKDALEFSNHLAELGDETSKQINDIFELKETGTYQEYIDAVIQFFKDQANTENGLSEEEIMKLFGISAFSVKDKTIEDEITQKSAELNQIFKSKFGENFDVSKFFSGEDILNADGLTIAGLNFDVDSFEEFELLYSRFAINDAVTEAARSFSQIQTNIDAINVGLAEFQKEGQMSAETLADLERRYPELAEIQDKTSHEYLQRLRKIREQEEDNAKKSLEEQKKALEEKAEYYSKLDYSDTTDVQVQADLEEFEKTMQDLLDTEYSIQVQVEADLKTDVEDAFGIADEFSKLQELVPDDLTVSFEEAQELINQGYAGILENATETAEQSIKLDKATMNAFIDNRQAELEEDKKAKIGQLENQKAILVTQRDALKKKLEALKEATKAENATDAAAAIQKAKNADKEYQTAVEALSEELKSEAEAATEEEKINEQLFNDLSGMYETNSKNQQQAEKDTTDGQKENIAARLKNVKKLYEGYMAVAEARLYSEGNGPKPDKAPDDGGGLSKGVAPISSTLGKITGKKVTTKELIPEDITKYAEDLFNKDKDEFDATINALIEATESQIDSLDQQIGSIDAGIAALKSAGKSLDSAQKGSGSDKKEEYKKEEDEIDRYWELNKAIEEVTEALSDLEKTQDKLYGKELIASLKQENILLEEQAKKYHALAEEQRKEAQELQGLLSAYGVVFDTQGGIANYLAASQAALAKYNQAVAAYNASLIDEATFEVAEKSYEAFKKQLERYESLYYDEMRETQNTLDDIRNQQLENNLQAWETEIQLRLDLSEAERDWKNFLKEINEDFKVHYKDISIELSNLLDNAKTYSSNGGTIETDMKALKEVMAEIDKMKNGGTSDMFSSISEAQEKLKELMSALQDDASALFNLYKEAWEAFMEGIDQAAEKFEELMDKFTRIDDELDYQKQLIELIYGEEAYELMDKLYKAQEKNTLTQIDSLKQQKDMWYDLWKNAKEGSEEQAKYYKLWTEAQDELNSKVIDYIELLKSDYLNVVNDIIKTLEKDMTGGLGLDKAKEQWDYQKEQMEEYSKGAEKLLKIETLSLSMQKSINDTTSLKGQQKLQAIYDEQIKLLREKEAITEYDLKMAENRYQIAVQELALEDAKNAKNAMKLTRNAEGNWSYQYVVDDEAILTAQQAKIDLYLEGMELAEQKVIETGDKIYETLSQYFEKYLDIMSDTTLSEEERQEELYELNEKYFGEDGLLQELNKNFEDAKIDYRNYSMGALLASYEADKKAYESMTDEEKKMTQEMINANIGSFAELESKINTNYENLGDMAETVMGVTVPGIWESAASRMADAWNADNGESIKAQCLEAHEAILEALEEYQDKMDEAADLIGEDWSEDGIAGAIEDAEEATEDLSDTTEEMIDDTVDALEDYQDALEEIEDLWYDVKDAIEDAIISAREYLSLQGVSSTPPTPSPNPGPSGDSGNDGGDNGKDKEEEKKPEKPKKETLPEERISMYSSSTGGNGIPTNRTVNKDNIISIAQKTTTGTYQYFITLKTSGKTETGYIDKGTRERIRNSIGLKTGGYTGEWQGGEGKLAFLHSKELVLNAQDTENILNAVQTVRDISDLSNVVGNAIQDKIESMMIKLFDFTGNNYNSNTINNTKDDHSDNIFNITAEFPNVNSVDTIKEAILNLPNYASQYIHQNRK